jgi:predicted site-specific integrase-resolvase
VAQIKVSLGKYAKINGICYKTAYRWFRAGKIPEEVVRTPTGRIMVVMGEYKPKID